MSGVAESTVEEAALGWFEELGYAVVHGPEIAPGELFAERDSYSDIVLVKRLRDALARMNPQVPHDAIEEAFRRVVHPETASLVENNRRFHQMLVEGVPVEYQRTDGSIAGDLVKLIDYEKQATTTGQPSTNSLSLKTVTTAARTFWSSLMACRLESLNSRTLATKTPRCAAHTTRSRLTRKISPASSHTTKWL